MGQSVRRALFKQKSDQVQRHFSPTLKGLTKILRKRRRCELPTFIEELREFGGTDAVEIGVHMPPSVDPFFWPSLLTRRERKALAKL
jgi:hypothetical protein